jgi:TPR repeat protein
LAITKLPKQWRGWNSTSRGIEAAVDLALATLKLASAIFASVTKAIFEGWKKMRLVIFIASLLILAEPNNSIAFEQPGPSCDDLGALAADPLRQSEPIRFEDIQANRLISACRTAIAAATKPQDQARYYLQLGRGQLRAGDSKGAISSFDKSASFAYPAGYFALGVAYLLGDDVKKDDTKAKDYLLLALENNVIWAAKALSALHENKASEFYDVERAENYLTLFQDSRF